MKKSIEFDLVVNKVNSFLTANRDKISTCFMLKNEDSYLHLSILLSDNNAGSQRFLFSFISEYDRTILSKRIPVIFQIIPSELEKEFLDEMTNPKFLKLI